MEYKNKMYLLKMDHDKMKFILSLRACRPSIMLELLLEKIKLAKKMFALQLEQEGEVLIPQELNQQDLPISFRFYDPIINESRRRFPE